MFLNFFQYLFKHAFLKRDRDNREPTHIHTTGEIVNSIPFYTAKLERQNTKISDIITTIENAKESEKRRFILKMGDSTYTLGSGTSGFETSGTSFLRTLEEIDETDGLIEENVLGEKYETPVKNELSDKIKHEKQKDVLIEEENESRDECDAPIRHIRMSSLEKNDLNDQCEKGMDTPVRQILRGMSVKESHGIKIFTTPELSQNHPLFHDVPLEVIASNSSEEEHQRDVSELPLDFMGGRVSEFQHLNQTESCNKNKKKNDVPAENIEVSHHSMEEEDETIILQNDALTDSKHVQDFNQINLSDLQHDPFCQLFFADIDRVNLQSTITAQEGGHLDDHGDCNNQAVESDHNSSPSNNIGVNEHEDRPSKVEKSSQGASEPDEDNNLPSIFHSDPRAYMRTQRKSNRSLILTEEMNDDPDAHQSLSKRSLGQGTSDDSASFYVLDEDANRSFLSDLRKELRKDASCRSLLSDSSQTNDIKVIVDTSLLHGDAVHTPSRGVRHNRSVTFDTLKTSVTSASKKTKNSIQKSLELTAGGMMKSVNVIQGGVKKSADVLQKRVKVSAHAMQDGMKKSVFIVHDGVKKTVYVVQDSAKKSAQVMQDGMKKSAHVVQDTVKKSVSGMKHVGARSIKLATDLIKGSDDGRVRDGGFVTFASLTAKAQCVQMLHHAKPFTFFVTDAPMPRDIYWNNVGLTHEKQQIGFFVAQCLTIGLCLCWTIPITFVSSFSEIDSLKEAIPTLEQTLQNNPWLQPVLDQLNPLLMVLLKLILPVILSKFCEREGHISRSSLNASLLTKLSIFLVSWLEKFLS